MAPVLAALLLLATTTPATTRPGIAGAASGPYAIDVILDTWQDPARNNRPVPVKIYLPRNLNAAAPVVLISHGLGGTREGYAYLGRHLASHGYIAVHVQHAGSDGAVFAQAGRDRQAILAALQKAATDPINAINRPRDISFAIDKLLELNKSDGPLKGRIDQKRIGIAGHSFGAYTALAVVGQTFPGNRTFRDDRIQAAVVMSPPARAELQARSYDKITIPILLMTGTLDESPIGNGGRPDDRRKVFDLLTAAPDRYLLVFDGGDHMVFSGRVRALGALDLPGMRGTGEKDDAFQTFIKAATLHFFNAHLRADQEAKRSLTTGPAAQALGQDGTWDHRPARK